MITGVAKKRVDPEKQKGELMESNVDAMEVSIFLWWGIQKNRRGS